MKIRAVVLVAALAVGLGDAQAESCRRTEADVRAGRSCMPGQRLVPYEPDRLKASRRPGFVDLGNGTEVRVGGRVRADYDARR